MSKLVRLSKMRTWIVTTKVTAATKTRSFITLGLIVTVLVSSCGYMNFRLPALGKVGKYVSAKNLLLEGGRAAVNDAVRLLEALATEDPFYRDALTYLGRAYYRQKRYPAALQVMRRAILVNKEDEIAWLTIGMVQLRLGDNQAGRESYKGGVALLSKLAKDGYRGYENYDLNNLVMASIRRAIFQVKKGDSVSPKSLIRAGEFILYRIDEEEVYQAGDKSMKDQMDMSG